MTIDTKLVNWNWSQGGDDWGFDPSITLNNPIEKAAVDALSNSEKTTIITNHKWACVRKKRGDLLISSDWTQGADVPNAIKSSWTSYRQALRDVTTQSDPDNIIWPTKPS